MVNLLRSLGWREFPSTTVAVWVGFGLLVAIGIRFVVWKREDPGLHINLGLALAGALIGGFLGICYHVVAEHCGLVLCFG
jgi:hypothetical protein